MEFFTLLVFAIIMWGLGFSALSKTKESKDFFEKNFIRVAIGMAVFVLLGVLFSAIGVPLEWKIFAGLAIVYPIIFLIVKKPFAGEDFNFKLTKTALINLVVLAIFLFSTFMYVGGSFKYPYLENDDPWSYAQTSKFVSQEKILSNPGGFKYMDPYPPAYVMMMGVLHQTNDSMYWTLKFFNGLIISLAILFFYFFAKEFTGSRKKALFSTFILASLPSFFTHFIWSHSLVVLFLFPVLYSFEKIKESKGWFLPAAIAISGILLSQPSQAIKLGIMIFLYIGVKAIYNKKSAFKMFLAGATGFLFSLLWWFSRAGLMFQGRTPGTILEGKAASRVINQVTGEVISLSFWERLKIIFPSSQGTATRAYTFNDFIFAKPFGGINVQVGWGLAISVLLVLGLVYAVIKFRKSTKKDKQWILISLIWFGFTFLAVNAMTFNFPLGFITFRFWLLLAIPVALLSSLGWEFLLKFARKKEVKFAVTVIILLAVFFTATQQKYTHNNLASWPPGVSWTSMDELQVYMSLNDLPADARVFAPSKRSSYFTLGFDKMSCTWCEEDKKMYSEIAEMSGSDVHGWLVNNNYDYFVVGGMAINDMNKVFGENKTNEFMTDLVGAIQTGGVYNVAFQNQGGLVLEVV